MNYADRNWSDRNSYLKTGFQLQGIMPAQEFWPSPKDNLRLATHRLTPNMLAGFAADPTPSDLPSFLTQKGYIRVYNAGNLKYIKQC